VITRPIGFGAPSACNRWPALRLIWAIPSQQPLQKQDRLTGLGPDRLPIGIVDGEALTGPARQRLELRPLAGWVDLAASLPQLADR